MSTQRYTLSIFGALIAGLAGGGAAGLLVSGSAPCQFLGIAKLVGDIPDSAYNFPASRSSFTCSSWISTPSAYSVAICSSV